MGLRHYFTGKACSHGHVTHRFVKSQDCAGCVADRIKRKRATPEGKKTKTADANLYRKRRKARDPEYKKKLRGKENWRYYQKPENAAKKKAANLIYKRNNAFKRDAQHAANTLAELLGVPHVVVETIDAAGNKTFQPIEANNR